MCTCSPCMNDTFRNTFTIKVRQFLYKMIIFKSCRSTVAYCAYILIITNRMPLPRCRFWNWPAPNGTKFT